MNFYRRRIDIVLWGVFSLLLAACAGQAASPAASALQTHEAVRRAADVPELPFADNPDPSLCGIPTKWGLEDPAWLSGYYEGELVQPEVYLYDSHLRYAVTGVAPSGSAVKILFYQENPELDYYMVETIDLAEKQSGWVPAPFLSLHPLEP